MSRDTAVAAHYSSGGLLDAIERGLATAGTTLAAATIDDLAPVDEFHIGGRSATTELCQQLDVDATTSVLDIGCGIGGTARFVSSTFGCAVTGIDLTPEYIDVARSISEASGLGERLTFETGNALQLPFDDASFDVVTQLHVGMNIDDKAALCAEVHRVLRPGGRYGIYDIMRVTDDDHAFPVPWASDASMSFVDTADRYEAALDAAGFALVGRRDRGQYAKDFFAAVQQASAEASAPPPIGLHLILGSDAPTKIANMVAAVRSGTLAPTELICTRAAD